jgi:hypothetical protein
MTQFLLAVVLGTLLMAWVVGWEGARKRSAWQQEMGSLPLGLLIVGIWLIVVVFCWVFFTLVVPDLLRFWQRRYVVP